MSMKNFSETIGNLTRDLQACSTVAQTLRHRDSPLPPPSHPLYSAWLKTASHLNTKENSVKTHEYPKRNAPFRGTLWWLSTVLPDVDKCDVLEHVADLPTSGQHISCMWGPIYKIYLFSYPCTNIAISNKYRQLHSALLQHQLIGTTSCTWLP